MNVWDKDCKRLQFFCLASWAIRLTYVNARGDDVAVAGIDILQSDIWEVIGKFLEDFLVFFRRFFSRNVHGQHFVTDTLSVVNGSDTYSSNISYQDKDKIAVVSALFNSFVESLVVLPLFGNGCEWTKRGKLELG